MTTAEATNVVLHERRGGVLIITLNRPARQNALDHEAALQLAAAVDLLDADEDLSLGVLTGPGGAFSIGMDLTTFDGGELPLLPGRGLGELTRAAVGKPLIAAVEGWALGVGFELALACDLVVAAADARFGLSEVTRGLVAAEGDVARLRRQLSYDVAAQLQRSGEPLSAFEAGRYGLVHMVTAPGGALDGALELAGHALKRQDELAARMAASSNRPEVRFVQDNLIGIAHAEVPIEGAAA
jgi:enoyl-CoA hydratase